MTNETNRESKDEKCDLFVIFRELKGIMPPCVLQELVGGYEKGSV